MEKIIAALLLVLVTFSVDVSSSRYQPENNYRFTPDQRFIFQNVFRQDNGNTDSSNVAAITAEIPEETVLAEIPEESVSSMVPDGHRKCHEPGFFKVTCLLFFRCVNLTANGGPPFISYDFSCPSGTVFNPKISVCDHEYNVPECKGQSFIPVATGTWTESAEETDDDEQTGEKDSVESKDSDEDMKPPGLFTLVCYDDGKYKQHPLYCNKYFICLQDDNGVWTVPSYQCPPDLIFDEEDQKCRFAGRNDEPCQTAPNSPVTIETDGAKEPSSVLGAENENVPTGAESAVVEETNLEETVAPIESVPDLSAGESANIPEPAVELPSGQSGSNPEPAPGVDISSGQSGSNPEPAPSVDIPNEQSGNNPEPAPGVDIPIEQSGNNPEPAPGVDIPNEQSGNNPEPAPGVDIPNEQSGNTPEPAVDIPPRRQNWKIEENTLYDCPTPGFFPYENDCIRFYRCVITKNNSLKGLLYRCPLGYGYSAETESCVGFDNMRRCNRIPDPTLFTRFAAAIPLYEEDLLWFFNN